MRVDMKLRSGLGFDFVFCGMTLIELLVVMAIMAVLVAVSVPALKPMLESQRAANSAKVVALKLQQARLKAISENKPCGVEFIRYANEQNASLQMRIVKDTPNWLKFHTEGYEIRCVVTPVGGASNQATIRLVKKRPVDNYWTEINTSSPATGDVNIVANWTSKVDAGLSIQFGKQGIWYDLSGPFTVENCTINLPSDQTNQTKIPPDPLGTPPTFKEAVEFNVTQRPSSVLSAVTVLPRGTVVDLQHSGHDSDMSGTGGGIFTAGASTRSIIVMFSPAGHVDRFYVDNDENNGGERPFRGVFYFLVGEWDRVGSSGGEDGKNNLDTESNFWVTIKDRDGTVRISPNATGTSVDDRRRHARQDLFNNIGGM
ncbi:MAG: prepilin-type N-terminal cleavage/methylation domain-containing protein [Planctomycetaceae bacterium]|jgi:prepilin-type N-terminal cleavage/methylation domain-containing protein|nr:prepilin-type N-terminal cleavage/methylation domain-containing protein [Planctomycetaceae bacterium]